MILIVSISLRIVISQSTHNYDYTDQSGKKTSGSVLISLCSAITPPDKCNDQLTSQILFVPDNGNDCVSLLDSEIDKLKFKLSNLKKPLEGFIMKTDRINFDVNFRCNQEVENAVFNLSGSTLRVESKDSCARLDEAARIFDNHYILLPLLIMIFGIILLFIGGYKWEYLISYIGFLVGFCGMYFIFWNFVEYKEQTTSYIIVFIVAIVIGLLLGYLCKEFVKLSFFLMGFTTGFFLAEYLLSIFLFSGSWVS